MSVMAPSTWRWAASGILCADTITKLPPEAAAAVVVSGSHGGRYPGHLAAEAGVRAVIFNDAGIGRDDAGVGSLPYLEALGIAAATVSCHSCLIGDTGDMLARGIISRANGPAGAAGVAEAMACRDATERLLRAPHRLVAPSSIGEARGEVAVAGGHRRILLLDSASLVRSDDAGQIIVTGSHGGLIGGDPALALRVDAYAAVFNDAGRPDGPGTARLPVLDRRGIAAFTVSASSARIGEAVSTFEDGIVSALNGTAAAAGARIGVPAKSILQAMARHNLSGTGRTSSE
jgi:hypothetical protein